MKYGKWDKTKLERYMIFKYDLCSFASLCLDIYLLQIKVYCARHIKKLTLTVVQLTLNKTENV
jgi:hypothetical protein